MKRMFIKGALKSFIPLWAVSVGLLTAIILLAIFKNPRFMALSPIAAMMVLILSYMLCHELIAIYQERSRKKRGIPEVNDCHCIYCFNRLCNGCSKVHAAHCLNCKCNECSDPSGHRARTCICGSCQHLRGRT